MLGVLHDWTYGIGFDLIWTLLITVGLNDECQHLTDARVITFISVKISDKRNKPIHLIKHEMITQHWSVWDTENLWHLCGDSENNIVNHLPVFLKKAIRRLCRRRCALLISEMKFPWFRHFCMTLFQKVVSWGSGYWVEHFKSKNFPPSLSLQKSTLQ